MANSVPKVCKYQMNFFLAARVQVFFGPRLEADVHPVPADHEGRIHRRAMRTESRFSEFSDSQPLTYRTSTFQRREGLQVCIASVDTLFQALLI